MSFTFNQLKLNQLADIINNCNRQYFITKKHYPNQIGEIDQLTSIQIDLFDLIDTQHTIINELQQTVNYLYEELSFRKMIIEKKDRILKELNTVMINKFIDKIYKQELTIAEMQKENCILQKYKNNTMNMNNQEYNWNIQPIITNITNVKSVPVNVIVPKNKSEYNGTLVFMNSAIKPLKNINRFINVKLNKKNFKGKEQIYWSNEKCMKENKSNRKNTNNNNNYDENDNNNNKDVKRNIIKQHQQQQQHMALRKSTGRSQSQSEYVPTFSNMNLNQNPDIIDQCNTCSNRSFNINTNKINNENNISVSILLNKTHNTLLNKSYDIIKKFHSKQRNSTLHYRNQSWSSQETIVNNNS